jgi:hypothetical protein
MMTKTWRRHARGRSVTSDLEAWAEALGPTRQAPAIAISHVSYGTMRMLEVLVEDVCAVRPFRRRGEAEEWLALAGT